MTPSSEQADSPWPYRVALALACAMFPLLWVGGLVTTYDAGMAVPDWPNTYGYNLFLYPWQTWIQGPWDVFIEHGHRLFGATVGVLSMGLVVVLWARESRRWVQVLGVVVLLGVILQGLLGGFRVVEDERLLAKIHGCFAPLVFSLSVAVALFTSALWKRPRVITRDAEAGRLHRLAMLTTALAYLQVLLGAELRHRSADMAPGEFRAVVFAHLAMAAVLAVHVLWLLLRVARRHRDLGVLNRPSWTMAGLLGLQMILGAAVWVTNFGWPSFVADYRWTAGYVPIAQSRLQAHVTTAHVVVGSLMLVTSVLLTLRSFRIVRPTDPTAKPISLTSPVVVEVAP